MSAESLQELLNNQKELNKKLKKQLKKHKNMKDHLLTMISEQQKRIDMVEEEINMLNAEIEMNKRKLEKMTAKF